MKKYIEIRPGEGGEDAQIFVGELADAYMRLARIKEWEATYLERKPSNGAGYFLIKIQMVGSNLKDLIKEAGGHRIQRCPPTERKGRIHTSTVTVSITDDSIVADPKFFERKETDFRVEWFSGTGKGGQHRNKHQNSARVIHIPTGLKQERQGRSRENNLADAKKAIIEMLDKISSSQKFDQLNKIRSEQVGSGMRGDKIRTIQFHHDIAKDHNTGKQARAKDIMSGKIDLLW